MKKFWKGIASVLFYVISGALLTYAASRSLDFVTSTLPPEQQIVGYLALAATSGGAVAWLLVFIYKSEGLGQKITAGLMVVVDLIGEIALFTMDTLLRSGESGMIAQLTPGEIRTTILAMSVLVGLNIIASFAYHLLDAENIREMQESFARAAILNAALKQIETRSEQLAASMGPELADQWAGEFEAQFGNVKQWGLAQWGQPASRQGNRKWRFPWDKEEVPVPVHASGNGHGRTVPADGRTFEADLPIEDVPGLDPTGAGPTG